MIEYSVLVRAFHSAPFIAGCVDSLLGQTRPPEEIVVYGDRTLTRVDPILRQYGNRIRLIPGPQEAHPRYVLEAHALQAAFAASHGETVFLADGSDRFKPDKIERYADAFDRHPDASLVQAPVERIDEHGRAVGVVLEPRKHVSNHLREIYRRQDVDFFYPASALAFSRNYLERVMPLELGDGLPLDVDARLCVPAAYYGRIVTLPDPLTEWRPRTAGDAPPARPVRLRIRDTFLRARLFNAFCRRFGLRTISPWRSYRFYLRLLRCAMPEAVFDCCARYARPLPGGSNTPH